jgi:hypothetical protein
MTLHSINREQHLYVIKSGTGYSCLGYDVAEKHRKAYLGWIGHECAPMRKGTKKHYAAYRQALAAAEEHSRMLKRHGKPHQCPVHLEPALRGLKGRRVEVVYPDGGRSRFWVGQSTGWAPCYLEIARRGSIGGPQAYVPPGATVRVVA